MLTVQAYVTVNMKAPCVGGGKLKVKGEETYSCVKCVLILKEILCPARVIILHASVHFEGRSTSQASRVISVSKAYRPLQGTAHLHVVSKYVTSPEVVGHFSYSFI
jgi:hypothetical protein